MCRPPITYFSYATYTFLAECLPRRFPPHAVLFVLTGSYITDFVGYVELVFAFFVRRERAFANMLSTRKQRAREHEIAVNMRQSNSYAAKKKVSVRIYV